MIRFTALSLTASFRAILQWMVHLNALNVGNYSLVAAAKIKMQNGAVLRGWPLVSYEGLSGC